MPAIGNKCGAQLEKEGLIDQGTFILAWIAVREYKRTHGTAADMAAWDTAAAKAYADAKANPNSKKDPTDTLGSFLNKDGQAFGAALGAFLLGGSVLPGWDDTKCRMDWHEYACFVNWASTQTPDQIGQLIGATKVPHKCSDVVRSDPAYDGELPMPGQKKATGWLPWVLGAVAVVGVGTGVAFYLRHHGSTGGRNPSGLSPSHWPYKATAKGMSSKWKSYTQYFHNESDAKDFLKEMQDRYGAKSGELHDRRSNTLIEKV